MVVVIGVVGATGAVGQEMVNVLARRQTCAPENLRLFASARSKGKQIPFATKFSENTPTETVPLTVSAFDFENDPASVLECDILLLASSSDFAGEYAPKIHAQKPSLLIIDNSSKFRYDDQVPLVVPEINGSLVNDGGSNLIANPNCTTAILVLVLHPILQKYGVKRAIASTYQAASGAGREGMEELEAAMTAFHSNTVIDSGNGTLEQHAKLFAEGKRVFRHPLCANLLPHIDAFQENGYTKEEMKVTWESRKICGVPDLKLSCRRGGRDCVPPGERTKAGQQILSGTPSSSGGRGKFVVRPDRKLSLSCRSSVLQFYFCLHHGYGAGSGTISWNYLLCTRRNVDDFQFALCRTI